MSCGGEPMDLDFLPLLDGTLYQAWVIRPSKVLFY
jgi:hypothetical protein